MSETAATEAWASDPEAIERIFRAALREGDVVGVEAALRLMLACDPRRGIALYDSLRNGLRVAELLDAVREGLA